MPKNEKLIQYVTEIINQHDDKTDYYLFHLDINDFQSMNFVYGLSSGDEFLKNVEIFLKQLDHVLMLQKLFSDHFIFVSSSNHLEQLLDNYNQKINQFLKTYQSDYPSCQLSISCGCCLVDIKDIQKTLDCANFARKEAKRKRLSHIVLYEKNIQEELVGKYEFERQIQEDLKNERFCFYLQPKVDLKTGEIVGAEALARGMGKNGEIISPEYFLPFMESNGTVVELDLLICRQVCEYIARRLKMGLPVVSTSINLSRLHIHNPNTPQILHSLVSSYHIPPELLEFEITETILLDEFDEVKALINQLRAYGYHVSIDDFGAGYAGVNIWQELDFDVLKLDKIFLSTDAQIQTRNEAIVPNLINIAHRLNIQVLCEGVESIEQCQYLVELGCTIAQGFLFSKPIPADQFYRIYRQQNGHYQTFIIDQNKKQEDIQTVKEKRRIKIPKTKSYIMIILAFVLLLNLSIVGVIAYNRQLTQNELSKMVKENLVAFTSGQKNSTLTQINDLKETAKALAVLVKEQNNKDFINEYFNQLNQESTSVNYVYQTKQELMDRVPQMNDLELEYIERLKNGKDIISEIFYSEQLKKYCIGIAVPVMDHLEFVGAIRILADAERLTSTSLYSSSYSSHESDIILASFIAKSDGNITTVKTNGHKEWQGNLIDILNRESVDKEVIENVESILSSSIDGTQVMRLGVYSDLPIYLAITDMGYNDWHLVICLQASMALTHSQEIVNHTMVSIISLMVVVGIISLMLYLYLREKERKIAIDERRYLLLDRFSDTILFDYDCLTDTIHFTSNVNKLLKTRGLTQKNFVKNLDSSYVFKGDHQTIYDVFNGANKNPNGELRMRFVRPDSHQYFWCLIRYQYVYKKDKVISIIGKITDIDALKQREEFLMEKVETDGLTGLYNKSTTENKIIEALNNNQNGILLMIDIDNFKQINDEYGHIQGDEVLRQVAAHLHNIFLEKDIIGRVGGDELVIYLQNQIDRDMLLRQMKMLEEHLKSQEEITHVHLSVSIGAAFYPEDGKSYSELFLAADQAMYAAKKQTDKMICFYQDIQEP